MYKKLVKLCVLFVVSFFLMTTNSMVAYATEETETEEEGVDVSITAATFPDENFRDFVAKNYDKDEDGILSTEEAKHVIVIRLSEMEISDLTGIEYFYNLVTFYASEIPLKELNLRENKKLTTIICRWCQLKEIVISENQNLYSLDCSNNELEDIDISWNERLAELNCDSNKLTKLDLGNNKLLKKLSCNFNEIDTIVFAEDNNINKLYCHDNKLTKLNVKNLPNLEELSCGKNLLKKLDTSANTILIKLQFPDMKGIEFDISKNLNLEILTCSNCDIDELDLTEHEKIRLLDCSNNKIRELNLSYMEKLSNVECNDNELEKLSINLNKVNRLECQNNKLKVIENIGTSYEMRYLDCSNNELIDIFEDGLLPTYIENVYCSHNRIAYLDLISNCDLDILDCSYNKLTSLTINQRSSLLKLNCSNNILNTLHVGSDSYHISLDCSNNVLTDLKIADNVTRLNCSNNRLTSLSLNSKMVQLRCANNALTSLDVKECPQLNTLFCNNNKIKQLDVSKNPHLGYFNCSNNRLSCLNLENNVYMTNFACENNVYNVEEYDGLDLSDIEGFEIDKVSALKNAELEGTILRVIDDELPVTYTYDVGQNLKANFAIKFKEGSSTVYNFPYNVNSYSQELAETSALYAMLAYDEYRLTQEGQYYPLSGGRQDTPTLLLEQLKKDGFYKSNSYNYRDHNWNNCSYTLATRNIKYQGKEKTQVLVCIRGTDGVEWEGNMNLTGVQYDVSRLATHYSFEKASDDIVGSLYNYLNTLSQEGIDTNECVVWVTGHSRGAAVGNLVAAQLTDSSSSRIGDVFAYTYATVNNTMYNRQYSNIFNHCFEDDFVPNVPFGKWGYGKYGITYTANADKIYTAGNNGVGGVYGEFKEGMDKFIDKFSMRIGVSLNSEKTEKMIEHVTKYWKNTEEYYEERCDEDASDTVSLYTFFHNGIARLAQKEYVFLKQTKSYTKTYSKLDEIFNFFVFGINRINDTHQSYTYYLATKLGLFNGQSTYASTGISMEEEKVQSTGMEQIAAENATSTVSYNNIPLHTAVSSNTISENALAVSGNNIQEGIVEYDVVLEQTGTNESTALACAEEEERLKSFASVDENNKNLGWNLQDKSTWEGISFDESGYVTAVNIPYKDLTGELNVSGFSKLQTLQCEGNLLTSVLCNNCISLEKVECYYNNLQTLECSQCEKLTYLDCESNVIETLDLSDCTALIKLICSNNELKLLDLTNQTNLTEVSCDSNKITKLTLPEVNSITRMNCEYNYLQDLSILEALAQKEGTWILYENQNVPENATFATNDLDNLKKFATTDKNLEKLGWNLEKPNTWSGITWKYVNGVYYVQSIELCSMELTGNIVFSDMEHLNSVILAENLLDSLEITNSGELKIINCADNRLEQLSLVNCNKISEIYAYYNCLSDKIVENIIKTYGVNESCIIELNSQYVKGDKEEFDSKEMKVLLSFAQQKYNAGRLMYDEEKPDRWDYITWGKQQDGYYHVIAIDYSDMMVEGSLDLSEFSYLQKIDCSKTSLEEVILPKTLEKITLKAFYQCKLLKKVCIPASVKTIEDFAFAKCSNLTEVVFYSKNASLDSYSFYGSDAINKIVCYYNTTEANYSYEGKPTFQYWDKKDMSSDEKGENSNASGTNTTGDSTTNNATTSKASKLLKKGDVIKKGSGKYRVTKIGKSYGTVSYIKCTNKKIKSVTIPSTITVNKQKFKVTVIGEKAFYGCKKLKKVTIGKNVIKIKKYAFAKCSKLKTIKIQSISLKSVGKRAFKGISKKATISVPSSKKKKYTKLLRKKTVGLSSSVKIKGYKKK